MKLAWMVSVDANGDKQPPVLHYWDEEEDRWEQLPTYYHAAGDRSGAYYAWDTTAQKTAEGIPCCPDEYL